MSMLYHLGKANVMVDAFNKLSIESVVHIQDDKKELVHEVHHLDRLGVWLVDSSKGSFWVQIGSKSSRRVVFAI